MRRMSKGSHRKGSLQALFPILHFWLSSISSLLALFYFYNYGYRDNPFGNYRAL